MASDNKGTAFTASDRVKQLNEIDRDVVKLLQSAGLAVKALTNSGSTPQEGELPISLSAEQQKESFTAATSQYFSLLSSLDVRLRRQIKALEEAQILPKEAASKHKHTTLVSSSMTPDMRNVPNVSPNKHRGIKAAVTGGGLGGLDIGWLNSRNDNIGKAKEAELWEEAQRHVHRLEEGKVSKRQDAGFS